MKRLFLLTLTLTLTLAAVASTQAGNKKQKNSGHSGGYARSVAPTQRQGGGYSGDRTIYATPRHSGRHTSRSYGSPARHSSKRGSRVRYY